jgi:hypothetical protein
MHQINLIDETFDKNQAHHYNLAIQYGLNGLSCCLFDTVKNKYIAFRHYSENESNRESLLSLFASDELIALHYKEVFLLYNAGQNTLVPVPYFDESKVADLYKFNFGEENNAAFYFNNLPDTLAVNLFSCSQDIIDEFKKFFPSIKIYHRTSPFLENLVQESARWPRIKCFVSIHQNILDIGLAHLRRLDFFNSFVYKEKSDIVYHILNVMEQFNLSTSFTDVYLSVDMEKHEEIYEYLNGYLTHVKFIRPSENFTYSYIFDDFQLTRFANLFNLALCVS